MYPNNLKARLRSGEIILGTSLPAPTPHVAGSVIATGPDFLWADTEHMPHATEALDSILGAGADARRRAHGARRVERPRTDQEGVRRGRSSP